jgi:hypothetical protein
MCGRANVCVRVCVCVCVRERERENKGERIVRKKKEGNSAAIGV